MAKLRIKKGDTVKVIAGEEKGKEGSVLKVDPETNRVFVEGLNIVQKHKKPDAANPEGGIVEQESPIHISNLMLVHNGEPTRVGKTKDEKTGKFVRTAKKTGEIIE